MSYSNPAKPEIPTPAAAVSRVGRAESKLANRPWLERLFRYGYVVRGIIYLIPGVLALKLALGTHGGALSQTEAIAMIGHQFMGRILLIAVAIGLGAYALWGIHRAVFDGLHRGNSAGGLAKRFGYATSGLAYTGLFAATVRLLTGSLRSGAGDKDWSAKLLALPSGALLLGIVGVCWIGFAGIGEILRGWTGSFRDDLAFERMSPIERKLAMPLGRFGTVARGLVFTVVGILLVAAARHVNSHGASGLDGALLELGHQPFGRLLLSIGAMGLIAFGAFSVMCARWMRMGGATTRDSTHSFHPTSA